MRTDSGSKVDTRPERPAADPAPSVPARPAGAVPAEAPRGGQPQPARVPARSTTRASARPPVWALVPGAQFAGDRYRLLERCGGGTDTAFWRARDTVLARDVALTVVECPQGDGVQSADEFFNRTGWLCRVRSDAVAAILDMFEVDGRAVVVAQWKPGHALGAVRAGRPADAAAALVPLAEVVRDGHGDGAVAAVDHPSRVRVGDDGVAYLAFPGVPADATARGDVRGLGNVLCELLTGMHHTGEGQPLGPSAVRPDVSPELSELVVGAVGEGDVAADRVAAVLGTAAAAAPIAGADTESGPAATGSGGDRAAGPEDGRTFWNTWGPYVAGGALLVVFAIIGWFVGVSLI